MLLPYLALVSLLAGVSTAKPIAETMPTTLPQTFHDPELGNVTIIASGVHIIPEGADTSTHAKRQNICSSIGTPDECCFDSRTTGWGWTQVTVNDGTSPNACIGYTIWPQEKCDKKWTDGDYDDIVSLCEKLVNLRAGSTGYRAWHKDFVRKAALQPEVELSEEDAVDLVKTTDSNGHGAPNGSLTRNEASVNSDSI